MKDLEELLNAIYVDIRKRNTDRGLQAIPQTEEFYEQITKAYSLIPFAIPKLIKMLVDSHKIFSFAIVEADRKERIRRVDGYVVAEGNIVKDLLERYGDELIRAYSHEFSTKYSVERIIKEFFPRLAEFNNTHLGIMANIVINLIGVQSNLERNIMQYGFKWQEKQLRSEIANSDPIDYFIEPEAGMKLAGGGETRERETRKEEDQGSRATDSFKYEDLKRYLTKNSVEKTITMYGIEFYSRLCFRDYQFSHMQKLIEDGIVSDKDDLKRVKKMLQKTRSNSDQDLNLQKFANDINDLEKLINNKIKDDGR